MRRITLVLMMMIAGMAGSAVAATISNATAKWRFPWNGKVDITYTLTGDVTAGLLMVTASNRVDGATYTAAASALSGDTGTAEGVHHVVWDLDAQGLRIKSTNVVFEVAYATAEYCVIDLSGGASASSYPVTYVASVPSGGFNTDEYKTTKLVLRLIEPGTFMMGGSYQVTLTKPFYCGVFEVTQKQYELVTGSNPSSYKGDMRPVERVSWNTIRGDSSTYNWPGSANVDPNSFIGRLQARTGLNFDLPTEAQWEYACRAGTTSTYNNGGDTENDLKQLGRYSGNRSDGKGGYTDSHTKVGSYEPNAWGLYDMHGNVWEWCLDWYGSLSNGVTDPVGSSSGSYRVERGGGWSSYAGGCASFYRLSLNPSGGYYDDGFRLVRTLSNTEGECSPEAVAGAERADALCAAEAAPVAIDSRTGTRESSGDEMILYSTIWDGIEGATVTITQDGVTLVEGLTGEGELAWGVEQNGTYTLTHTTFTNGVAGKVETAVFAVTGKDAPFAPGDVTVTGYSGTYDGAAHGVGVSVASGIDGATVKYAVGAAGAAQPDGEWSATPPAFTDAGEYAVWCEVDAPNYIPVTNTISVTISPYAIGNAVVTLGSGLTYNGAEQTQLVAGVTVDGFDVTYTTSGDKATDAGNYTLTVTGTGNFTGTATKQFTVARKDIAGATVTLGAALTYNGEEQTQAVSGVTVDGLSATYTVDGNTATDAGTYTLTVTGTGNFTGTETKQFTVLPKTLMAEMVTLGTLSYIYDGTAKEPTVTVTDGNPSIVTEGDYDVAYSGNVELGTATVTVTGKGNYAGTVVKTFEITPDSVTIGGATWQYVVRNGTVEIVGACVLNDVVVIPDEIGGVPVTTLPDGCFAGNAQLRGVVVGCNVAHMGTGAFQGCESLSVAVFRGDEPADLDAGLEGAPQDLEVYFENGSPCCPELSITPVTGVRNGRTAVTISRGAWSNVVVVRYTTDGSDPVADSTSYRSRFSLNVTALTVVRAAAFLGDARVGRIAEARYSPDLDDLLDVASFLLQDGSAPVSFAVDDAHPWWSDEDEDSLDGTPSMRSGTIGHNASSWMSATFTGAGLFEFFWKTSCEQDDLGEYWYDHAVCELDGEAVAWLDGETEWTRQTLSVTNGGVHTVKWIYVKDDADDEYVENEDCAWVDGVKFSREVSVSFAVGGASGEAPATVVSAEGCTIVLPGQGEMSFAKHAFGGWTDGTAIYAGGGPFVVPGTNTTLAAVWAEKRLAAPTITATAVYDGITTPVSITAEDGASIWYTLDGSEPSADGQGSRRYQGTFNLEGSATIKAVATRDDWFDSEVATVETVRSWGTLGDCLDNQQIAFETSGGSQWYGVAMASATGGTALRSGAVGDSQESRLECVVSGAGQLSFRWKVSSESFKQYQVDYVAFSVDGVELAWIGGEVDWTNMTFAVSGEGSHTVRWTYIKDSGNSEGEDCAWVDAVAWTPNGALADIIVDAGNDKTVTVPRTWIAQYPDLVVAAGGDAEAAVRNGTAANGRKVWECYVVGLDPEIAMNDFKITSFPMKADGTPDLANMAFAPPQEQWNVPEARAVVKGAATLDGEWKAVEGVTAAEKAAMRFFKVVVEVQ